MIDAAPWGVVVHRGFAPLYVNHAFVDLFGLSESAADEPDRVSLFRFFADAEQALRDDADRLMEDELAFTVREVTAHGMEGRERRVRIRARRIDWRGEGAIEYVIEDVSAARGAPREDASRAATMTAVLDMVPEAVLLIRGTGEIDWANLAALRLLGLPDQGPGPHDIADVLGPEDTGWAQDYIAGLAEGGLTHLFTDGREVAVITADGRRVPALMALERIDRGSATHVCAVLRDISEWRDAESKMEEARGTAEESSSRKTEFLAKVSHELRTPLTAILGFAQVMARQDLGPIGNPRYVEYAKDILDSGDHLLSLINDLLDMSKVESGKFDLSFDSVDVHDLAEGCVRLMSPIAGSRQVTLRHTVEDTLPSVVADERSMRQILLNLISNALRFTEGGGEVVVSAEVDAGGGLTLAVTDTGVGMSEEELALALEPFEQVEKDVASGTPGTGLGLPLARALTEANRAQFRIESAPKAGTRVALTFAPTQVLAD
jgi:PAS domain S-box-containing protein